MKSQTVENVDIEEDRLSECQSPTAEAVGILLVLL
jgi:hypothetical protein